MIKTVKAFLISKLELDFKIGDCFTDDLSLTSGKVENVREDRVSCDRCSRE
jgi:hypothetical protein